LFLNIGNVTGSEGKIVKLPRHIDWIINTPLQLITLGNIGRITAINMYALCFLDVVMIISGLLGELTSNYTRWSFFGVGCICFFPLYIFLFEDFDYHTVSEFAGEHVARAYYKIGRFLLSAWLFYPFVWIMSNADHISTLYEGIFYSILDFLSKVCFPIWVLFLIQQYLKDDIVHDDEESVGTIIAS
jgi:bacteriorhodopsin